MLIITIIIHNEASTRRLVLGMAECMIQKVELYNDHHHRHQNHQAQRKEKVRVAAWLRVPAASLEVLFIGDK